MMLNGIDLIDNEGVHQMQRLGSSVLALAMLAVAPLAHADYLFNLSSGVSWSANSSNSILLYQGGHAIGLIKLSGCLVNSGSTVQILSEQLGSYDGKILIDQEVCDVGEVKKF